MLGIKFSAITLYTDLQSVTSQLKRYRWPKKVTLVVTNIWLWIWFSWNVSKKEKLNRPHHHHPLQVVRDGLQGQGWLRKTASLLEEANTFGAKCEKPKERIVKVANLLENNRESQQLLCWTQAAGFLELSCKKLARNLTEISWKWEKHRGVR